MATSTGSLIASSPAVLVNPEAAPPYGGTGQVPGTLIPVGYGRGIGFPTGKDCSVMYCFYNGSQYTGTGTGIKVSLLIADDPNDTNGVVSKAAVFDVMVGKITSDNMTFDENSTTGPFTGSTAVAVTSTMPATLGKMHISDHSITYANANTPSAGSTWLFVRIRRNGTSASDTDPGRVVLLGFGIVEY